MPQLVDSSTLIRLAWGTLLLRAPRRVLETVRAPATPDALRVTRVLGARHLCQAAAVSLLPEPSVQRWSRRVDEAHGLSMALLATTSRRYRWAGLTSMTIAWALVRLSRRGQ